MIQYNPQIPWSLWIALATLATIGWLWYAVGPTGGIGWIRRAAILPMMLLGVSAPLAILLNPTWVEPILPPEGRPLVSVLVDATQSMQVQDCGRDRSRWQAAVEMSQRIKQAGGESVDVNVMRFDASLHPLSPEEQEIADPQGPNTNLAAVLRSVLEVDRPQGHAVVMLSDGAHNAGQAAAVTAAAHQASSLDVPIYTTTFGGAVGAKNIAVAIRNPQLMTFPQRRQTVKVNLSQRGFGGQSIRVELRTQDRLVATKRIRLTDDAVTEVEFVVQPEKKGLYRYLVSASQIEGEATHADNKASLQLQVIDEPISVLLLEGKPYWDTKFLAKNLASDPSIELTTLVRIREGRFMRRTDPAAMRRKDDSVADAPSNASADRSASGATDWQVVQADVDDWSQPESLNQYRVVVLGRWTETFLDEQAIGRLRNWISHEGGALVCSRGQPTSELEKQLATLLPVRWSGQNEFRARGSLTSAGSLASLVSDQVGPGDPLVRLPSLALGSRPKLGIGLPQVLVQSTTSDSGQTVPLVSHQPFGSGQTVVVEGAGMWRWAFLPPEQADHQRVYGELWQGLMQWLISQQDLPPGQQLALRSDRLAYITGGMVTASLVVADPDQTEVPDCLLKGESDDLPVRFQPSQLADDPGVFRVNFGNLAPGHYSATLEGLDPKLPGATTEFDVRDPWFERLEIDARPSLMSQIANRSGGRVVNPDSAEEIMRDFEEHLKISRPERSRRTPLWDRPWVLLMTLGAWITCWVTRRKSGLV